MKTLGILSLDEDVYRTLLEQPGSGTSDLSACLGMDEASVRASLERLSLHGMISFGEHGEPQAVDPGISIARLAEERLKRLQDEQREVLSSSHLFLHQALQWWRKEGGNDHVEPLADCEPLHSRADELIFFARHEVLTMQPNDFAAAEGLAGTRESDLRCLRRGIALRALVPRQALEDTTTAAYLTELIENGARIRFLSGSFERVLITDSSAALVQSAHNSTSESALLIREDGLVRTLQSLFDHCWSSAADAASVLLPAGTESPCDAFQLRVLEAMTHADKDEVGARELGISVRTYRGHIARLLKRLDAATRVQAALHARDRGWI
ncbi:helix-turn-helix domain-containing protein [Streptomyces sp. NPDC101152]|uniref:helix-turn-helix domain-containing protein n=1 Tax=Streptomyces sp. NPDC101152 TaxID=3366116 RepID=UPI0038032750